MSAHLSGRGGVVNQIERYYVHAMLTLGIESSCDETAAAVVDEGGPGDLTFAVATAAAGHRIYTTEKYWRGCD